MELPVRFAERMRRMLGEEYEAFLACYGRERKQGLRVNTAKLSAEDFLRITPFSLTPIPWTQNGFYYAKEEAVTRHPHYYAGLYYVQEPSAMVPASVLPIREGDRVLDLCAAPGGKATELGARLHGTGLLVANDISASRAAALQRNLERFGIANAFVTAEAPGRLVERFGPFFDKILVDAPCSGEGMFRKDQGLIKSWEERGPEYYAPLQREILSCAVRLLRPGGMLLYSTCTFSEEEDEGIIADALERFGELELEDAHRYPGFAPGRPAADRPWFEAEKCIRIWPHRMEGEGHFAALLRKRGTCEDGMRPGESGPEPAGEKEPGGRRRYPKEDGPGPEREKEPGGRRRYPKEDGPEPAGEKEPGGRRRYPREDGPETAGAKASAGSRKKRSMRAAEEEKRTGCGLSPETEAFFAELSWPGLEKGEIDRRKDELFLLPSGYRPPQGIRYLRTGLFLGTEKKGRFEPSQALAMVVEREAYPNRLELASGDPSVGKYLKGETLELSGQENCRPGWVLVCCDGHPLGWAKNINGSLRNKYAPGWRMQ